MTKDEITTYWIKSSDNDFQTMTHLFESGDYSWSLFIGHLVVEKLLKAYYVKNKDLNSPFIHDLLRIAKKSGIQLNEEQKDFLDTVTTFNINARYDDYKMDFYQKCTKKFTEEYKIKIKEFRTWIKQKL